MIRIMFVATAAQLIVNKGVDARKRNEADLLGAEEITGSPIRDFNDIPPQDIETFNGGMDQDGMFEHVSCDKASGACYHLDNGSVQFDRTMRINDYRKIYQTTNNNNHKEVKGNNDINVNVLQTIEDHGEKIASIRHEIEDHVSDKLTLHYLVIFACIFTPIVFGICIKIAVYYYREYCRKGASQKRAQKETMEEMEGLFEENPTHALNLLKFLLAQYSPTFCNQYLAKQEANVAKRIHQQATDEEMRELVDSKAITLGLHSQRPYSQSFVHEAAAPPVY